MNEKKKIGFPRMADYNYAVKYLVEKGLEQQYVMQPQMTKKTLDIGSRYSPDTVCTPFKTTLGSMIEALEAGADTLVMICGPCRLGYFGELQAQILKDMGYEFQMIDFATYDTGKKKDYLKVIKAANPNVNPAKLAVVAAEAIQMVEYIDDVTSEYYINCGFEVEKGSYKRARTQFFYDMENAKSKQDIEDGYNRVKDAFRNIQINKGEHPLRVGIIGEYYTVMDAFSNLEIEQKLADMRVEVHRWMNVSHRNIHYSGGRNLKVRIQDYCEYEMGPTSIPNIWCARDYAERDFDGLIHIKSAGCAPEIDVMPVLQNISRDYKIPILYLTYDTQTSDTGLMTRVEAFYDMLQMRKKVIE